MIFSTATKLTLGAIGLLLLLLLITYLVFRYRRSLGKLQVVSRRVEDDERMLYGIMATRRTNPWQAGELHVLVPLAPRTISALLVSGERRMPFPYVQQRYIIHPVTGLEIQTFQLTELALRQFPAVEPLAKTWEEAVALAEARAPSLESAPSPLPPRPVQRAKKPRFRPRQR